MSYSFAFDPLRHNSLLLDTNLLLLYIAGTIDRAYVTRFRRTQTFVTEDFDALELVMSRFSHYVTTANVLTEVSNLTDSISGDFLKRYVAIFHEITDAFREEMPASREASRAPEFSRLGLTDAGILLLSGGPTVVLTDDLSLYLALEGRGASVLNFNHVRTGAWGNSADS